MATITPWGAAQSITTIAQGIRSVSTAGHGGILVAAAQNVLIPEYMRCDDGAYEEDCDWCIPAVVFETDWRRWADSTTWTTGDFQMRCAWSTLLNCHPDAYESFTGKMIQLGQSQARDAAALQAATREQYVVRTAWGHWHKDVPDGMVGVAATRASDGSEKYFLVPETEYEVRNTSVGKAACFVVTPGCHAEVTRIR